MNNISDVEENTENNAVIDVTTVESDGKGKKKRSSNVALFLTLLVLVIAGASYILSRSGIDEKLVREQLDNFATNIKLYGERTGQIAEFTYGDIVMQGGALSRKALVKSAQLSLKHYPSGNENEQADYNQFLLSSDAIVLSPSAKDFGSVNVEVTDSIKISMIENYDESQKKQQYSISFDKAFGIDFAKNYLAKSQMHAWQYQADLPAKIIFTELNSDDTAVVALGEGSSVQALYSETGEILSQEINLTHIHISNPAMDDAFIMANESRIFFSEDMSKRTESARYYHYIINAKGLHAKGKKETEGYDEAGPVDINLDAYYNGPLLDDNVVAKLMQGNEYSFSIKDARIALPEASIALQGEFNSGTQNDFLPVGEADLTVVNFPYFRDLIESNDKVNADKTKAFLHYMLTRSVGTGYYDTKDLTLDIIRGEDGVFRIGNMTFEELLAVFIGGVDKLTVPQKQEADTGEVSEPVLPKENKEEVTLKPLDDIISKPAGTTLKAQPESVAKKEVTTHQEKQKIKEHSNSTAPSVQTSAPVSVKTPEAAQPKVFIPEEVPAQTVPGMPFKVQVKSSESE